MQHHRRPCHGPTGWEELRACLTFSGCLFSALTPVEQGGKGRRGRGDSNGGNSSALITLDTENQGRNLEIGIKSPPHQTRGLRRQIDAASLVSLKPPLLQMYAFQNVFLVPVFSLFLHSSCSFCWRQVRSAAWWSWRPVVWAHCLVLQCSLKHHQTHC